MSNELVTTKEAARRSGISLRLLQYHILQGNLPATKPTGGRDYLIRAKDLEAFAKSERKRGPKPQD